ncbi:hypothetical protein DL93DRAFT_729557 [Clavulina sp. PMI_390]|nr:hypothetical protein DL93DRAFT_729557 [Clavulina sp. PMI_390]
MQADCVHHLQEGMDPLEAKRGHYELLSIIADCEPSPLLFEAMANRSYIRKTLSIARESLQDASFLSQSSIAWDDRPTPQSSGREGEYLLPGMFDTWELLITWSIERKDPRPIREAIEHGLLFIMEVSSLPCLRNTAVICEYCSFVESWSTF